MKKLNLKKYLYFNVFGTVIKIPLPLAAGNPLNNSVLLNTFQYSDWVADSDGVIYKNRDLITTHIQNFLESDKKEVLELTKLVEVEKYTEHIINVITSYNKYIEHKNKS